jgi:3-methyladenine DNA glycosylase AlkD
MEIEQIRKKLIELGNEKRAIQEKRYLKSPYEFYGVSIPNVRLISKELKNIGFRRVLNLIDVLWNSGKHEEMWLALHILSYHVKKHRLEVWEFLMKRLDRAKTWDLTDEMSGHVLGPILAEDTKLLDEIKKLGGSKNPWLRRISIITSGNLIRKNEIELTLTLAENLIYDEDIYVQKGAGWMLREAGKKNGAVVREFILKHIDMKPIAFSYATEKMEELREIRKTTLKRENYEKMVKQS